MKRTRNLIIVTVGLLAIVAFAAFDRKEDMTTTVTAAVVHRGALETKLAENGIVQRPQTAVIPSMIAGNVEDLYVRPGELVAAGQLLATVNNPQIESSAASAAADYGQAVANIQTAQTNSSNARVQYEATLATQKAALEAARRMFNSDIVLYGQKAIARNQLEDDRTKLEEAQIQYDQAANQLRLGAVSGYGQDSVDAARANAKKMAILDQTSQRQLSFTRIVAPFAGQIQSIATEGGDQLAALRPGDAVQAGAMMFTIARGGYIVKAKVDEQDVTSVQIGQRVRVTSEDFPNKTIGGIVSGISPTAIRSTDDASGSRQVLTTILLDQSPSYLRDGMSVNVDILTKVVQNVVLVPNSAILKDGKDSYVYVIAGGIAHKKRVSTAGSNDAFTAVTAGVPSGASVVSDRNALPGLKSGAKVTASVTTPAPTPSP